MSSVFGRRSLFHSHCAMKPSLLRGCSVARATVLKMMNRQKPASPIRVACRSPGCTRVAPSTAGSVKSGSESRPPRPSSDAAARPPTAVSISIPAVASIPYCRLAPAASPAGSTLVSALPASPDVTTANQPLVRKARRWRVNAKVKLTISAMSAPIIQIGLALASRGHRSHHLDETW